MQATIALRRNTTMPTFIPGWNAATLMWFVGGVLSVAGIIGAAFVTARYSVLGKVLDAQTAQSQLADGRASATQARFDEVESRLHAVEAELHTSRSETLAARQEVLVLRQENIELRESKVRVEGELVAMRTENKRLSGDCDKLRRQLALLHPDSDLVNVIE